MGLIPECHKIFLVYRIYPWVLRDYEKYFCLPYTKVKISKNYIVGIFWTSLTKEGRIPNGEGKLPAGLIPDFQGKSTATLQD